MTSRALNTVARPGAILSQLWPPADQQPGLSLRGLTAVADEDFFEAVLASPISDAGERREIAALVADKGIHLTYGMIPLITAQGLSLATSDADLRARSVVAIQQRCDEAREAGAMAIMVSPGPAPASEAERQEALALLTDSLKALCAAAPDLRVMIEPLDVTVHKKQALGYTPEAIALAEDVRSGPGQFAGLDMYGDHHPPLGAPGFLDVPMMADLMAVGREIGFLGERRPELMIEQFNYDRDDFDAGLAIMRLARQNLTTAWELATAPQ